jgi:hypothetical protein
MRPTSPSNDNGFPLDTLTHHAKQRMTARRLSREAIRAALSYGRVAFVRGAEIFAIGHKEVRTFACEGVDLSPYEGVQVVCTPDGIILTAYRNRDFRALRPGRRTRSHRRAA